MNGLEKFGKKLAPIVATIFDKTANTSQKNLQPLQTTKISTLKRPVHSSFLILVYIMKYGYICIDEQCDDRLLLKYGVRMQDLQYTWLTSILFF